MKIIMLTGAPGAGKTTIGSLLVDSCPHRAALIETDAFACISPWRVDDAFHALVGANIRQAVANYRVWGAEVLVISGVIVPGGIFDEIQPLLAREASAWSIYGLQARKDVLERRIWRDEKPQNPRERIRWLELNQKIEALPGRELIDTTTMTPEAVVDEIGARERWWEPRRARSETDDRVEVSVEVAETTAASVLSAVGFSDAKASRVAVSLVRSELEGYRSHGLLRLPEYVRTIADGHVDPSAEPVATRSGAVSWMIDARNAIGAIAADAIWQTLVDQVSETDVAVVGLKNSGHLGRLAHVLQPVADLGAVGLGFVNYMGACQAMPPYGGAEPRLCTNPICVAVPTVGEPLVLDMTTSAVAEGAVREAYKAGRRVPRGWLVDRDWRPVTDPAMLYSTPISAMLAPFGAVFAHKGAGLGVAVEVLSGILAGSGFAGAPADRHGNGGFFLAIRPAAFGRDLESFVRDVETFSRYYESCSPAPGFERVRLPGRRAAERLRDASALGKISVDARLWEQLCAMAREAKAGGHRLFELGDPSFASTRERDAAVTRGEA